MRILFVESIMDKKKNMSRGRLADVTGEVVEADLRRRRFQLWRHPESAVCVPFDEGHEDMVTTALKNHKWTQLRVQGRGEYSSTGKLLRITQVERMELLDKPVDPSIPSIEDIAQAIAAEVPESELERIPKDFCDHLDHYIYGTPKRPRQ